VDAALAARPPVAFVEERRRADRLLRHPLRLRVLGALSAPASASDVALRLGLPRQRVNYHVRELHRAGFLRRAGRRRKRGLVEQHYVASAQGYVLSPEILGPLAARRAAQDAGSAGYQMSLLARSQAELARVMREAETEGKRVATLSIAVDVRFTGAAQRQELTRALERAVVDAVGRFSASATREDGTPGAGRPFRLVLACHPIPKGAEADAPPPDEEVRP
jgi:hypothetical protein